MKRRPSYTSLLNRIAKSEPFPPFSGPPLKKDIVRTEKGLGHSLEGEYRTFVERFGDQEDFGFCGVNSKYKNAGTLWISRIMHTEYGLPKHYLVVWADEGYTEAYAMDCRSFDSKGNGPIDYFRPVDIGASLNREYPSFRRFLEDYYSSLWQ